MKIIKLLIICFISINLAACAGKKKSDDEKILPAEELYNQGMTKLNKGSYKKAIENFEELERTYPYSKWAIKAQVMSAYSSFKNEEYTDAIITLDKFISLHPGNKDISYVYYLKAICYYEQISDIGRDQSYSIYTRNALNDVVARFPDSEYARDAQIKLDLVQDHLAGKEVEIGRFYLKNRKYISAINRFKAVVDNYQSTSHTPEALHRLVEANMALGLKDEAQKYAAVLGYNFPGSKWYEYSYRLLKGDIPNTEQKLNQPAKKSWQEKITSPFNIFRKGPDLIDNIDRHVHEVDEEKPVKVEPVAKNREVKINEIEENTPSQNPSSGNTMKKLGNWFKNIKVPFMNTK